ncbi:hypothetical protein GCM10027047_32280 [Rhodococcus aerolatus]
MRGDGNGWAAGPDGLRRWGRHGAAGLLLRAATPAGPAVLLQHRAVWSHQGGTWGLPGGARDSHESTVDAAVREAGEETGLGPGALAVRGEVLTSGEPGGWTYTTVVADAPGVLATTANEESEELRWVAEAEVAGMPLHPGLAASWPALHARPARLLVDTANVLGSRPDGWWRDRAGATTRLLGRLAAAFPRTVALPGGAWGWVAEPEAVLEGAARDAGAVPGVRVHRAAGSGDDEVVTRAGDDTTGAVVLVVTADRGLRDRLGAAALLGPGELLGWLDATA